MLLITGLIFLGGCCMASTTVSSIGTRQKWGNTRVAPGDNVVSVKINDTKLHADPGHGGLAIPYKSLNHRHRERVVDIITVDLSKINWKSDSASSKFGEFECMVNGKPTKFDVRVDHHGDKGDDLIMESDYYRQWYGYPAQSLLVIAIPLDVVTGALITTGLIINAPVILVN